MVDMIREGVGCHLDFEVRAVEDVAASQEAGHWVGKDVIYVKATKPGGTSVFEAVAENWITQKELQGDPNSDRYRKIYEAYKSGQEEPEFGTPLRNWPNIGPAQIKACNSANVRTVEELAELNDSGLEMLGMGARGLQNKARAYLESAKDHGVIAEKVGELESRLSDLVGENQRKDDELRAMKAKVDGMEGGELAKDHEQLQKEHNELVSRVKKALGFKTVAPMIRALNGE